MNMVFSSQIGCNSEVCIDVMIVKTNEQGRHCKYFKDILKSFERYNTHLNPTKIFFRVQESMFLGFMPTRRGIKVNPKNSQEIIDMRSPFNVKEVQQLTRCLNALSNFISCTSDKLFNLFTTLNKNEKIECTNECEEAFTALKVFLATLPILMHHWQDILYTCIYQSITRR